MLHSIISQKLGLFSFKYVHDFFLIRHHRDILTDKYCEHVYELVYSSHRAVAQAAGEFLNERLFVPDEEAVAGIRTKRGKKRLPNTPLIRDLVQFFIESEVSNLVITF
jgi:cohesin complex subunit SA-1/2